MILNQTDCCSFLANFLKNIHVTNKCVNNLSIVLDKNCDLNVIKITLFVTYILNVYIIIAGTSEHE